MLIKNYERNYEIYKARVIEQRTLSSIAKKYGLTRQRIHQIVVQMKELVENLRGN